MANSAFHPSGVGKWVPASTGKAKAGMVHSVSGWTRGVQVKLWDPLRMHAISECLRGVFTTRRYTNTRLPLPYLMVGGTKKHPEASRKHPEASGVVRKRPPASPSTPKTRQTNILPHFCWNANFILQSLSHIFLKMSTAKKCSCLSKTSFHCFHQSSLLVWANN